MNEAPIHPTEEKVAETSVHYTPVQENKSHPRAPIGLFVIVCVVLLVAAAVLGVKVHQLSATVADTKAQLAQSQSETARAKTGIDGANAASARLRSQLDQAGKEQSGLQARLAKSEARANDLQPQLDKASSQASVLQTQLETAKTQLTASQSKIDQANAESADLRKQLDQAKTQSTDLQSRLDKAESAAATAQPVAEAARQMPITTSFGKAFLSRSLTLHIKNSGSAALKVNVTVNGADKTPETGTIKSGETLDVTKLEAGQNVVIASEGFEPVKLTVQ